MRTLKTTCVATGIILATLTGLTCNADESKLKLHGKTIIVYPIAIGEPGKPDVGDSNDIDVRIAEGVAVMLERFGMKPDVLSERPKNISSEDSLPDVEKKVQSFQGGTKTASDYFLFARIEGERTAGITRVCGVLTDSAGQVVWSQDPSDFPDGPIEGPMGACQQICGALLMTSDLKEPASEEDVPYGPMAAKMDERSGVPPKPERDAMHKRFEAANASFSESTLSIYPFRVWKTEDGSVEGAEALAEKLNEAGLFKASVANTDTKLKATRNPNQMKIMWDTARDFRSYLRKHPADTNYALLVDVTIPTHHVHIVLCEGSGEWVTVSLMNSHHPEFKEIDPETLEDCVELAFRRLKSTIE